jgi:hypothetical protein
MSVAGACPLSLNRVIGLQLSIVILSMVPLVDIHRNGQH